MKYHVKTGFMAKQFGKRGEYSIGLDCKAIDNIQEYEITVGNSKTKYFITRSEIEDIISKYGEGNVIKFRNNKNIYILPLNEMRKEEDYGDLFDF